MPSHPYPFRIAPDQSSLTKSQQALMTLDQELQLLVYRGIMQLAKVDQREALLHLVKTEYGVTLQLPPIPSERIVRGKTSEPSLIAHLVIVDGQPQIWYEKDNPYAMAWAFALGRRGFAAADRLSYRSGMTPPPDPES